MRTLIVAIGIHLAVASQLSAQYLYWTRGERIERANLDGSDAEVFLENLGSSNRIVVDVEHNAIFWAEYLGGRLRRTDLDATHLETYDVVASGVNDLALHPQAEQLYWVEHQQRIRRINYDGSAVTDLLLDVDDNTMTLAVDSQENMLYWGKLNSIHRTALKGDQSEEFVQAVGQVGQLKIDPKQRRLVWSDYQGIKSVDLAGGDTTLLVETGLLRTLVLDTARGHMYWKEQGLRRANLDGSDIQLFNPGQSFIALAIDPRECAGNGLRADGTCICDPGWTGENCSCSQAGCLEDCSNQGQCVCGICVCDAGWEGPACDCSTACPNDCSGHGSCDCGACVCDPGYVEDDCSCFTGGCPGDCSGHGTCDCGNCICDAGWDGPDCSCVAQECPNDCSGHGTCVCGVCDCAPSWIGADCSTQTLSPARVFLAPDGLQNIAAPMGNTTYLTPAGTTLRLIAWMEDVSPEGFPVNAYQMIWPMEAQPLAGAIGSVKYVDVDPGGPGGDSIVLNQSRPDWFFSDHIPQSINYHESSNFDFRSYAAC